MKLVKPVFDFIILTLHFLCQAHSPADSIWHEEAPENVHMFRWYVKNITLENKSLLLIMSASNYFHGLMHSMKFWSQLLCDTRKPKGRNTS